MPSLPQLLQQDAAHTWLFIPTAILLGALHGLEPGHSKTMMAAFIIAIRGTVAQAILLGLSAALSHTAIVWIVALGGQYLWRGFDAEAVEPYLQLVSAVIIAGIAAGMIWRIRHGQRLAAAAEHHDHGHHDHGHHHGEEVRRIDTGHGVMVLEVFEDGVPPRWRIRFESGHGWAAGDVSVVTERADASRQVFAFVDRGGYLESREDIPEPHAFMARVRLGHDGHTHDYDVPFVEGHGHDHLHEGVHGLNVVEGGAYIDAHERAHADDISRRFRDRNITTTQIILFGLTGGLIPCPAAITVLLLCLQLKQWMLGVALVGFFSVGLAITMVTAGVVASLSVRQVRKRWSGFGALARRAPYASGVLMLLVALYMAMSGLAAMASHRAG
ncbi:nickel/cobalt efflux transporter [Acidomonas methanolica]|uniref:nickel/cobalt efflux transporter n=1 Tax=Acidomonas methanolica TaxID=437 RepID=UPI00211A4805|nr:nickel/cobalt efflux transporter [Acidomonas methanolica]MCQ9156486.1 nickel/cobalt efflux transporter RcnA [Acidomonas methanolica]